MLPHLTGSYEESPPSLIDLSVRDRRWCQGNLQHARVIGAKGLTWPTRQHFATGIMAYLASPFWLAQLFVGILLVLQSTYVRPEYFTQQFSLFPTWPRFDAERALALFELTMGILLAPKFFGLLLAIGHKGERQACGGAFMLILSALLEILISALVAPIMMLIQSGAVTQILLGRDTGWNPQRRDDGSIPMADIIRRHRLHVGLGVIVAITAFIISPSLFGWMSPTIIGLVLSIPLSAASSSLALGLTLKKLNLLLIPEERSVPPVIARANELQADYRALNIDEADGMEALALDPALCEAHLAMLPTIPRRHRGDIDAERAVAEAKLADAQTLADAINWLKPKERNLILSDRALLHLVTNLPLIHTESTSG
jgi:membrane glycosyltransferase